MIYIDWFYWFYDRTNSYREISFKKWCIESKWKSKWMSWDWFTLLWCIRNSVSYKSNLFGVIFSINKNSFEKLFFVQCFMRFTYTKVTMADNFVIVTAQWYYIFKAFKYYSIVQFTNRHFYFKHSLTNVG